MDELVEEANEQVRADEQGPDPCLDEVPMWHESENASYKIADSDEDKICSAEATT